MPGTLQLRASSADGLVPVFWVDVFGTRTGDCHIPSLMGKVPPWMGPEKKKPQQFNTFQEAFCYAQGCVPNDYHARAFVQGVSPWRRFYVVPVFWVFPGLFEMDIHIVDYLGSTRSKSEFSGVVDEFHKAVQVSKGISKRVLGLRMSGATLVALRDRLDPLISPRS